MNTLDIYITDNILSYLNINESIFINKKYYNINKKIINKAKFKICYFYRYYKAQLIMKFEYYDDLISIQNYYILYYPKEYKKEFMISAINTINTINRPYILNIINLVNKNSYKINYYFKLFIRLLNLNELMYLGW